MNAVSKFVICILGIFTLSAFAIRAAVNSPFNKQGKQIVFLGYFSPHKVDSLKNGIISIGFLQSAQLFTLSMKLSKAVEYKDLLELAAKNDLLLKVYVSENSTEIARVQRAPDKLTKEYKKSIFRQNR